MEASHPHLSHALSSRLRPRPAAPADSWGVQLGWFVRAAALGFSVPFLGSSVLGLQHDVYLGTYFAAVLVFFTAYAVATQLDVRAALTRHWKAGLVLGVLVGIALVRNVLSDTATPRPHGAYYVFELIWRGGVYGAVDALLLTVLPCLVVYRSLGGHLQSWSLRLRYFASALVLVLTITAAYHLGYAQYRQDGIGAPETGNTLISLPMLLTANPLGSIADHAAMHISAVAHSYNTEVRLPPATKAH